MIYACMSVMTFLFSVRTSFLTLYQPHRLVCIILMQMTFIKYLLICFSLFLIDRSRLHMIVLAVTIQSIILSYTHISLFFFFVVHTVQLITFFAVHTVQLIFFFVVHTVQLVIHIVQPIIFFAGHTIQLACKDFKYVFCFPVSYESL